MQRSTPLGPNPGALTVRTDTLVPLAVLCAVPVLSDRGHAAARGRAVAVFDHPPRKGAEPQVDQVVPVSAPPRAGQQQGRASLRRQHAHGLALGTAPVLVLM
ncbi:hypothetical protein G6F31_021167 [Rhizopus arrhizus]|nr:hypothetical protein G6F31_021167 [Rhizopus arrhizus]